MPHELCSARKPRHGAQVTIVHACPIAGHRSLASFIIACCDILAGKSEGTPKADLGLGGRWGAEGEASKTGPDHASVHPGAPGRPPCGGGCTAMLGQHSARRASPPGELPCMPCCCLPVQTTSHVVMTFADRQIGVTHRHAVSLLWLNGGRNKEHDSTSDMLEPQRICTTPLHKQSHLEGVA